MVVSIFEWPVAILVLLPAAKMTARIAAGLFLIVGPPIILGLVWALKTLARRHNDRGERPPPARTV
jgi:hypothetical protein